MIRAAFSYLLLILVSLSAIAQIEFEEGYFIDLDSSKVTTLIKNEDWGMQGS